MTDMVYGWGEVFANQDPHSLAAVGIAFALGLSVIGAAWGILLTGASLLGAAVRAPRIRSKNLISIIFLRSCCDLRGYYGHHHGDQIPKPTRRRRRKDVRKERRLWILSFHSWPFSRALQPLLRRMCWNHGLILCHGGCQPGKSFRQDFDCRDFWFSSGFVRGYCRNHSINNRQINKIIRFVSSWHLSPWCI
mmetsp:Transcript_3573/g.6763  ORF Transcript_3573/g.6763 Transcript_3573/m.6763 type:complete len:192 (+) Transcript_3573:54-629(+)